MHITSNSELRYYLLYLNSDLVIQQLFEMWPFHDLSKLFMFVYFTSLSVFPYLSNTEIQSSVVNTENLYYSVVSEVYNLGDSAI